MPRRDAIRRRTPRDDRGAVVRRDPGRAIVTSASGARRGVARALCRFGPGTIAAFARMIPIAHAPARLADGASSHAGSDGARSRGAAGMRLSLRRRAAS
jgi:hypothetical protein